MTSQVDPKNLAIPPSNRRTLLGWLSGLLSAAIGAAVLAPAARFVGHPLRHPPVHGGEEPIAVATLGQLPEGVPVRATVVAPSRHDAWTRYDQVALGAVWLVRQGDKVTALSSVCPHAGCFVDFTGDKKCFACPCHGSVFALSGEVTGGPSPRPLDTLEVTVQGEKVLVRYQRFRPATSKKERVG